MSDLVQSASGTVQSDRECLLAWQRKPGAEASRPMVERYLAFVYSSAYRRIGDSVRAAAVTRVVFLVLARRGRKLRKKTVLAGWLYDVTAVASRKLVPKLSSRWRAFGGALLKPFTSRRTQGRDGEIAALVKELDPALDRLPPRQRNAVLLRTLLNYGLPDTAKTLLSSEPRARKSVARGLKNLTRRLDQRGVIVHSDALQASCAFEGCSAAPPDGLDRDVLAAIEASLGKRPSVKLARQTLNVLAWRRWRKRFVLGVPCAFAFLAALGGTAWYIDSLSGHSRLITEYWFWSVRHEAKTVPGLAQPARPWSGTAAAPRLNAASIRSPQDLFLTTNVWLAHLKFSRDQWKALQPARIAPLPNFFQPNGTVLLRNPKAQRSGLAGVMGIDFNWAHANFEFGGKQFTNVASRFKGNGTYVDSLYGPKQPFKIDLNRFAKGQRLGGIDELNFHNLIDDRSCMCDALGYEFFRDAGVPAPRTAYAYLSVSVERKWDQHPLGLYLLVEGVNGAFEAERFGSNMPLFKPVTYDLFKHLGDQWPAYAPIYDLKTRATEEQLGRVIDFARLVSHASDAEFASHLGDFLDLDEFARFLAGEVLLSSYDSLFSHGQNFYLYLDPKSNKLGFIPWDLDMAWGGFFVLGTIKERERASIWHPWVGENRFLERVMAVEEFRKIYRAHLEDFLTRLFVPERLYRRIDELAATIRSPIAAESDFRLAKFDWAIGEKAEPNSPNRKGAWADRPAHQLKRFIKNRAISVRNQLDGKSKGVILQRHERK